MILQWLLCDRQNYPMPDWRWLLDRDDSPWYSTARLFRQDDSRQWNSAFGRLHAALDDFLHRH
jgi:hypothetical protein